MKSSGKRYTGTIGPAGPTGKHLLDLEVGDELVVSVPCLDPELQSLRESFLAGFPKPPKVSLPIKAWRAALRLFDVPKKKVDTFAPSRERIAWDFSELVGFSPYGMNTDARAVMVDQEQLIPILKRLGVIASFEERPRDYRVRFKGDTTTWIRPVAWKDTDFHGQVFDWERILPKNISVYALVELDKTDTLGHIFLPAERWQKVQDLLGDWFGATFWKHPANPLFRLAKSSPGSKREKTPKRGGKRA
jgi:hypothetical protein